MGKDIILKVIEDNKELETSLDDLIIKMIESSNKSYRFWSGSEKFETQFSIENITWLEISSSLKVKYFYYKSIIDFIDSYKFPFTYDHIEEGNFLISLDDIKYYFANSQYKIEGWLKI